MIKLKSPICFGEKDTVSISLSGTSMTAINANRLMHTECSLPDGLSSEDKNEYSAICEIRLKETF